jgi:hypothetical protein
VDREMTHWSLRFSIPVRKYLPHNCGFCVYNYKVKLSLVFRQFHLYNIDNIDWMSLTLIWWGRCSEARNDHLFWQNFSGESALNCWTNIHLVVQQFQL